MNDNVKQPKAKWHMLFGKLLEELLVPAGIDVSRHPAALTENCQSFFSCHAPVIVPNPVNSLILKILIQTIDADIL